MLRRPALAAIAAGVILCASGAGADQSVHRIGVLRSSVNPESTRIWLDGLREHRWRNGANLRIDCRYCQGRNEQIPALAAELVASRPRLRCTPLLRPSHWSLSMSATPLPWDWSETLARPGGHATGFATMSPEGFMGKAIQLLREVAPSASRIAQLINPSNPGARRLLADNPEIERLLGVKLIVVEASSPDQLETAFDAAIKQGAEAMQIWGDPLIFGHSAEIVALAARSRLPAGYFFRKCVLDGGLLSLGPDTADRWRRAGAYVDKILKGERPADLPVKQPTGYELVVNLKTAAVLGITVPPLILAEANEVIE